MNVMNSKPTKPEEYIPGLFDGQKQIAAEQKPKEELSPEIIHQRKIGRLRGQIKFLKKNNVPPPYREKLKDGTFVNLEEELERLENG